MARRGAATIGAMHHRCAAVLAVAAALLAIAACDDGSPPPAPVPLTPNPSPVSLLPSVWLLRADQMSGYTRSHSSVLNPTTEASDANDPTLAGTLQGEGFVQGARWEYQPAHPNSGLPFLQVVSQATLFGSSAGAGDNAGLEARRNDQPPSDGGTITTVTDLPTPAGVQSFVVYRSTSTLNSDTATSWLAIMRRGRVVAELFAGGAPGAATEQAFSALVATAASRLDSAPA